MASYEDTLNASSIFSLNDNLHGAESDDLVWFCPSDDSSEWCEEHGESLSKFCLDDLEPLCKLCAAATHAEHRVYLLTDAATDCKEELKSSLNRLSKKMRGFEKVTQTCKHATNHNQTTARLAEEHIRNEFKQLHEFLQREEADRLLAFRAENEEKIREAHERSNKVDLVIKCLEAKIQLVEEELDAGGDGVEFLRYYQEPAERPCTELSEPQGTLINVAKHLGNLRFSVWDKMKHITPFTPVTLDPRTAGRTLQVSHGLHSILTMPGSTQKESHGVPVPANPERFHPMSSILSREGFNSGVHSWDIEVGDTDNWTTGVAVHSISRQIAFEVRPEAGLWCICLRNGEYLALTTPSHTLNLEGSPRLTRIRVKLNWDEGWLDFKNADTNGSIFTFRHRFEERVYPYFESISTSGILSLVAQKVSVRLDHDYMEDAAVTNEVQATKSNSTETDITTAPTNSEMSESREGGEEKKGKKSQKSTMKSQFVKRKPTAARVKTSENKSDVKKQTSKIRFSDNYHISLFRAMKITNKETSKQK